MTLIYDYACDKGCHLRVQERSERPKVCVEHGLMYFVEGIVEVVDAPKA